MSKATKVDRVVTYHEWLLPIEPHDPLLRGLSKPSYKLKNIIFPVPECLWLPRLAGL